MTEEIQEKPKNYNLLFTTVWTFLILISSRNQAINEGNAELYVTFLTFLVMTLVIFYFRTPNIIMKDWNKIFFYFITISRKSIYVMIAITLFSRHFEVPGDMARLYVASFLFVWGLGGGIYYLFKLLEFQNSK